MEDKVKLIQETLEVDANTAQKALDLADQDLDKALEMVELVDKSYVIVQGKINYGGYNRVYGLFNLVINGTEGELIRIDSVLNSNSKLWEVDLTVNNNIFIKTINSFTPDRRNVKEDLSFVKLFNPAQLFKIFKLAQDEALKKLHKFFKEELETELEETIEVELEVELKNKLQLEKNSPELFSDDEEKEGEEEPKDDQLGLDIELKCRPFISPTQGKRPVDLRLGDKLLVEIVDQREIGRYFKKLLTDDSSKLVSGQVTTINFDSALDRFSVTLQFGPKIYGQITTGTEIKIATNQLQEDKNREENKENKKTETDSNFIIFILLGLVMVLLVIAINIYL
ncbi:hypothetical protein JCM16358_02890 [Halanaerocella petrolearia]